MQYYSAIREGADAIITRNSTDFDAAQIEVYEPQQFLDMLTQKYMITNERMIRRETIYKALNLRGLNIIPQFSSVVFILSFI